MNRVDTKKLKLFEKTPANFKKHYNENYDKDRTKNSNINRKRNPPTYKNLIEKFIQYEENDKLDEAAYINLSKSIFPEQTSEPAKKFNKLLKFAAGTDKEIDIYEWLIINYLFERVQYTEFVDKKLNNKQENYEKFVNEVRSDKVFTNIIQTNYRGLSKKKAQFTQQTQTPPQRQSSAQQTQQEVQEKIKGFKRQINDNFKSIKDGIKELLIYENIKTNTQNQEVLQNLQNLQDSVIKENIIKMIVLSKNLDKIKEIINSNLFLHQFYKDNYDVNLNNDEIYKEIYKKIQDFNKNNLQNRNNVINDICEILIEKINYYKSFITDLKDDVNMCNNEIVIDRKKRHQQRTETTDSAPTTNITFKKDGKLKILDKKEIIKYLK